MNPISSQPPLSGGTPDLSSGDSGVPVVPIPLSCWNRIEEKSFDGRTRFVITAIDSNGNPAGKPRVVDPVVSRYLDGHDVYFLMRDSAGFSDDRFYHYLNVTKKKAPVKTRKLIASALRRFKCFLGIHNIDETQLTPDLWTALVYFILGVEFVPSGFRGGLRQRSVSSANQYLVAIQMFLRLEGIHYEFLERSHVVSHTVQFNGCVLRYSQTKSVFTLRDAAHGDDWVPNFVNPGQFKALLDIAQRNDDRTATILLKLMYFYGLRLGECLGLTQEDVVMYGPVSGDRGPVPMLRIRNRVSDKDWQHAKRIPVMTRDYTHGLGPRTYVLLTKAFFAELQEYIQDTFTDLYLRHPDRLPLAEATILTDDFDQDENHYLFFNRYGKPLSDAAWNTRLKKYYKEAGIVVDRGRKGVNLSHQLRHGCAMLLFRFLPEGLRLDEEQLRRYLRHKRLESSDVYKRMTPYEQQVILEELQSDMARELPFISDGYEAFEQEWRRKNLPPGAREEVEDPADACVSLDELIDDVE